MDTPFWKCALFLRFLSNQIAFSQDASLAHTLIL